MTASTLDSATAIVPHSDTKFFADGAESYWNFQSAFGGWALATALESVRHIHEEDRPLACVSATFLKPLVAARFRGGARRMRQGRSASFYRVEFCEDGKGDAAIFTSDLVFAQPKQSDVEFVAPYPEVTNWDAAPVLPSSPGPRWLSHYEQRIAKGQPFTKQATPESAMWLRDASGRPWDEKGLLAASDTPMPRTMFLDTVPRFAATVSYNFHLFAPLEELEALGCDPILIHANSPMVRLGRISQDTQLWSADGSLIAVSNQLAFL